MGDQAQPVFLPELFLSLCQNLLTFLRLFSLFPGIVLTIIVRLDCNFCYPLLEPDQPHGMDALAQSRLGYQCIPITELIGKKGKNQKSMADLDPKDVFMYACEDADITWQLADTLLPELEQEGLIMSSYLQDYQWVGKFIQ